MLLSTLIQKFILVDDRLQAIIISSMAALPAL